MHNFVIEQLNANDDEYVLLKYLIPNNHFVKKDQSFVEIETSKTAVVLDAPCDGYLVKKVEEDSKIKPGDIICSFSEKKLNEADLAKEKSINKVKEAKKKQEGFKVSRPYNDGKKT